MFRALPTLLAVALLLCALALISTYTFLPPLLEKLVARDLQGRLGLAARPEVDLTSDSLPNMLLDRFEEEGVTNKTPELVGLRPDEAMVDLRPFELGVLRGPAERTDQGPGATLRDL